MSTSNGTPGLPRQALRLALLRSPGGRLHPSGTLPLTAVLLLHLLTAMVFDHHRAEAPVVLFPEHFLSWLGSATATVTVLALLLRWLRRPQVVASFSALLLLALWPLKLAAELLLWFQPVSWQAWRELLVVLPSLDRPILTYLAVLVLLAVAALLVLWRAAAHAVPSASRSRRLVGVLGVALLMVPVLQLSSWGAFFHHDWSAAEGDAEALEMPDFGFDPEAAMYGEAAVLDSSLQQLPAQKPDEIDLYAIAFGGDGAEPVFRNEVEYVARLFPQRLGAREPIIALYNSPDAVGTSPIASLSSLRAAINATAAQMDVEEDVLLLFLTSHGLEDHTLYVALEPLPLAFIAPDDIAASLDDAGIRWRIVIVSSCYSGGFIPALADARTMVLTASRQDRTSFGCGVGSDITWFGQALLAEALNEETDLAAAFELARSSVERRERAEELTPSEPQIHIGQELLEHLQNRNFTPGPPLPFEPQN